MPDRPVSPFCLNCLSLNPDQHIALRNEGVPESSMREIERREVKGYRNYEDTLIYIAIQKELYTKFGKTDRSINGTLEVN
ncbi:hypothetical protein MGN70_012996 [Eutypa lata]|nr:hypothetical protein MGN70_012996 [Eutypa lata]